MSDQTGGLNADLKRKVAELCDRECKTPMRQLYHQCLGGLQEMLRNPLVPRALACAVVSQLMLLDLLISESEQKK